MQWTIVSFTVIFMWLYCCYICSVKIVMKIFCNLKHIWHIDHYTCSFFQPWKTVLHKFNVVWIFQFNKLVGLFWSFLISYVCCYFPRWGAVSTCHLGKGFHAPTVGNRTENAHGEFKGAFQLVDWKAFKISVSSIAVRHTFLSKLIERSHLFKKSNQLVPGDQSLCSHYLLV